MANWRSTTSTTSRAWIDDRRDDGDPGSVQMGVYLLYMLTGQTRLDDLQNDRYPDIHPTTLDELHPESPNGERRPQEPA